jgi:hypothetical protein
MVLTCILRDAETGTEEIINVDDRPERCLVTAISARASGRSFLLSAANLGTIDVDSPVGAAAAVFHEYEPHKPELVTVMEPLRLLAVASSRNGFTFLSKPSSSIGDQATVELKSGDYSTVTIIKMNTALQNCVIAKQMVW